MFVGAVVKVMGWVVHGVGVVGLVDVGDINVISQSLPVYPF